MFFGHHYDTKTFKENLFIPFFPSIFMSLNREILVFRVHSSRNTMETNTEQTPNNTGDFELWAEPLEVVEPPPFFKKVWASKIRLDDSPYYC